MRGFFGKKFVLIFVLSGFASSTGQVLSAQSNRPPNLLGDDLSQMLGKVKKIIAEKRGWEAQSSDLLQEIDKRLISTKSSSGVSVLVESLIETYKQKGLSDRGGKYVSCPLGDDSYPQEFGYIGLGGPIEPKRIDKPRENLVQILTNSWNRSQRKSVGILGFLAKKNVAPVIGPRGGRGLKLKLDHVSSPHLLFSAILRGGKAFQKIKGSAPMVSLTVLKEKLGSHHVLYLESLAWYLDQNSNEKRFFSLKGLDFFDSLAVLMESKSKTLENLQDFFEGLNQKDLRGFTHPLLAYVCIANLGGKKSYPRKLQAKAFILLLKAKLGESLPVLALEELFYHLLITEKKADRILPLFSFIENRPDSLSEKAAQVIYTFLMFPFPVFYSSKILNEKDLFIVYADFFDRMGLFYRFFLNTYNWLPLSLEKSSPSLYLAKKISQKGPFFLENLLGEASQDPEMFKTAYQVNGFLRFCFFTYLYNKDEGLKGFKRFARLVETFRRIYLYPKCKWTWKEFLGDPKTKISQRQAEFLKRFQ